jgi:hypothetical protein
MRDRGFNSRWLLCGRSTWVTAARHPASTIIFDRPAGLQIARYIDVEPGTRRILRCSPEWLETAQPSPSPRGSRRSAIPTRSSHSICGRTVGYGSRAGVYVLRITPVSGHPQERVSPFSEPSRIADHGVLGPSNSRLSSGPTMPRDHPE